MGEGKTEMAGKVNVGMKTRLGMTSLHGRKDIN